MIEIRYPEIAAGGSLRTAYDSMFEEHYIGMRDSFYLWLLDEVGVQSGMRVADIACGHGRLIELATQRGARGVGFDFAYQGMAQATARTPQASWVCGNGKYIPFPSDSFDYVFSIGSLEHYDDPQVGTNEIARIVKPNGKVCILLPNAFGLLGNIQQVFLHGEVYADPQPLQRYATRASWETMLHRAGLTIERVIPYGEFNWPRTPKDVAWTLRRPQKFVKALLTKIIPTNLANHFIFVCQRTAAPVDRFYPMLPF